jgi:ATP-dependent DNA helicase RecG
LKGRRADKAAIVAAVVCFANAEGGLILWGVADDGTIEGTEFRDADALRNHIYTSTAPAQLVATQTLVLTEGRVIAVWVDASDAIVSTTGGGYTHRVGRECLPLTPDRLVVRQITTGQLDASAAITPYGADALDPLEVERFRRALPEDDDLAKLGDDELVRAIQAVRPYQGRDAVTLAGLLVLGRQEQIRTLIPHHEVVYVRTTADGVGDYDRRITSSAPLLSLVEDMQREVAAASRTRILRLGARDLELPDYPDRALREALVNAVAHRHLTLAGHVVITQTATSLEIENPGGFPEGITAETVIRHAPVHRNRLLCEILERVRYMERSGLGVDRIFVDQLRLGKPPPVYDASRLAVRLRLDASAFDEAYARFVLAEESNGRVWSVDDLLMTAYLRRMGPADRPTLAAVIQRSEEEAQEYLSRRSDLVERQGGGVASRYALTAEVQAALGTPAAYTRERGLEREYQRSLVLQHVRKFGEIDNPAVRELLQMSMGEATRLLQSLELAGVIEQVGSRRWARYIPVVGRRN